VWHSSQLHTLYGPTPPSPLSDLVWSSPTSNEDTTACLSSDICEPLHMVALWARRKKAKTGNIFILTRDVARPSCEFIHCPCAVCLPFRKDAKTWQPGVCCSVAGCKCPRCRRHYDSTGRWDSTLAASAQLYIDMVGFTVSVSCAQGTLSTTMPVALNFDILPPRDISCLGLKPASAPYVSHTVDRNLAAMVTEGCRLTQQPWLQLPVPPTQYTELDRQHLTLILRSSVRFRQKLKKKK